MWNRKSIIALLLMVMMNASALAVETNPAKVIAYRLASHTLSQKQSTRKTAYSRILGVLTASSIDQAANVKTAVGMIHDNPSLQSTLANIFTQFGIPHGPLLWDPESGDFEANDNGP